MSWLVWKKHSIVKIVEDYLKGDVQVYGKESVDAGLIIFAAAVDFTDKVNQEYDEGTPELSEPVLETAHDDRSG